MKLTPLAAALAVAPMRSAPLAAAPVDKALTSFDTLPDAAHVRLPTVAALAGVSRVTVWRWCKLGRLPAPVKRGNVTAWRVGELRKALAPASV